MAVAGPKVIRPHLIEQHRRLYPLLPFAVLGAVDPAGDAWATIRTGHPGFLASPDPGHLVLDLNRDAQDPADAGLEDGDAVALLGIDLATRRRNRLNGRVVRRGPDGFAIAVEQSYGNCPQLSSDGITSSTAIRAWSRPCRRGIWIASTQPRGA